MATLFSNVNPPSPPETQRKGKEGEGRSSRTCGNWIRTDQSARTVENPASDYIIALRFHTSVCGKIINMDESDYGVEQATLQGEGQTRSD